MSQIDGTWNCTVSSPMGPQDLVLTLASADGAVTGKASGQLGSLDIEDGRLEGDTAVFKLGIKVPMPMMLDVKATASGDTLDGTVTAGAFGSWPIKGTRA
jgi:hypothetical protein